MPNTVYMLTVSACRALGVSALKVEDDDAALRWFGEAIQSLPKGREFDLLRGQTHLQIAQVYEARGDSAAAQRAENQAQQVGWDRFSTRTKANYAALAESVRENDAQLIAVQYPMRDIEPLEELLRHDQTIRFVDNGPIFREAVAREGFWEIFSDQFAGDFGHMKRQGRLLLASNVARAILATQPGYEGPPTPEPTAAGR